VHIGGESAMNRKGPAMDGNRKNKLYRAFRDNVFSNTQASYPIRYALEQAIKRCVCCFRI